MKDTRRTSEIRNSRRIGRCVLAGARPVVAVLAVVALASGCADGSSDSSPEPDPTSSTDPSPPPTATVTPTPVPGPTPSPTPVPTPTATADPEAAAIAEVTAAWERYLRLSIEARGKDPSPEALDFDSYVAGDAKTALLQAIADGRAAGTYVEGATSSSEVRIEVRPDGAALVSECTTTDWRFRLIETDRAVVLEGPRNYRTGARLELIEDSWIVLATEFLEARC